jgi:glycosyltransferase involved in cell wall biosynthesis
MSRGSHGVDMSLRVAIVHDWLTGMRGGERVLESMLELFPNADIFTLVHVPGSVSAAIEAHPIHTSFLQSAQERTPRWRRLLPLFPAALARFDLTSYDLVLSSSHCVAKAANGGRAAVHVAYVHSPMRYLWDQYDAYFGSGRASPIERTAMRLVAPGLRRWDRATADRPDVLIANSAFIRDRIRRVWGRESSVIHPPVDVARFRPSPKREDFHLVVGALVPYKRVDVAVDAFRTSGRRLMVVGDGPEYRRLRAAASPNIEFAGRLPDADVANLMGRCRTFLQPGE